MTVQSEMLFNGCEIFSTSNGYFVKDLSDGCPFYYNSNFNLVKNRTENAVHPMKSMYWDAAKYDKFGKQKHNKVLPL